MGLELASSVKVGKRTEKNNQPLKFNFVCGIWSEEGKTLLNIANEGLKNKKKDGFR